MVDIKISGNIESKGRIMPRVYIRDLIAIEAIIRKAQICHLAMTDEDRPYVIPMHFGYDSRTLYFHSGKKGKKIEIIKKNPNVSFALETDIELIRAEAPCGFTARFRSVAGFGQAALIEDREEKIKALSIIMRQYSDGSFMFPEDKVEIVAIIKVDIREMTARVHGFEETGD
jgi:nitroimidazol reductase NimA-like FMN-containing flavoprotein (pyridoxamine 5'-phosphate oxidase superfamily)